MANRRKPSVRQSTFALCFAEEASNLVHDALPPPQNRPGVQQTWREKRKKKKEKKKKEKKKKVEKKNM
eukprot:1163210-Rhodomonas_salina.1